MPGYRVSTLEPAKGGIVCPHCKLLLRDAVQTIEEGLRLCESCYKEICCIPSRTCEDCGISLGPKEQFYPDRAVRRDVLQVNVRCNYHTNGCTWVGQLQDLEEHSTQCRYKPVCCPNEGCGQLLVPDDLDRHIDEECLYRRVNCEHCGQQECANSLKEHHRVCPKYPIECGQCKERVSRDGMELHQLHNCPYVLCAVEECSQKLLRTSPPPPSASESTEEHLTNPNRVFHHIQGLGLAVRANRKLIKKVQSECSGQDDRPSQPEVDRTVRTIENRLTVLQRMVESDRISKERQIEELQLKLKQRDGKLEQLEQKVKFVERENKQSQQQYTYEGWTGSTNQSTRTRYDSTLGVETGYAAGRTDLSTERMVGLEKKMEELERQTALLKVHVSELELQLQASLASTHNGSFLWRIPDISRRRRDAMDERITSIYSPPFYTGRNGYKMCIRAYLNGDGIGYKTHLSLFFVLMKGEYDPLLKWPFDSKVSLILVDQNHRKHVVQTFKPAEESSSFERPKSDMNIASGCPQFAKLSVLDDKNYVDKDVLYVKCIVDTSKIFHP